MRIIVTRPEAAAGRTAGKLAALGHDPVLLPLFEPVRLPSVARQALAGTVDGIAITSAEAVRTLEAIHAPDPALFDLPVFAVGEATAKAAAKAGFKSIITGPGDGQGLAALVIAHDPACLVYLAGRPRSGQFEAALDKAGIRPLVAEVYEMKPVAHSLASLQATLIDRPVDAVMLYSRLNAESFVRLPVFEPGLAALEKTIFLCISPAVVAALPEALQRRAIAAMTPDETAMLDLL